MLTSSDAKLELISLRLHLCIYQLLFVYIMLLNFEFIWMGIYLFISSTLVPSLVHNMYFKKFQISNLLTFVFNVDRFSVILNTISLGNCLVYCVALAKANNDPNAEMHHLRHLLPGNNLSKGYNFSTQCPLGS